MPILDGNTVKSSATNANNHNVSVTDTNARLAQHAEKIHQLENALTSAKQFQGHPRATYNLLERMERYKVPSVSIALIDKGEVAWVKSWGIKDADTQELATPQTLFQAASISKPASSIAALRMVEAGLLSLDKPINHHLKSWKLPENGLTEQVPVTLTHLLSHTGGLTVHGFRGYAQTEAQPTAIQVLNGDAIANSAPVLVDTLPGTNFRYSGGGSTVFQVAMEDAGKKSFTQLMDELVLTPAGMTRSTYAQPLPDTFKTDVASGHLEDGRVVPGKWHNYPMQSPASLWTTPTDLAKLSLAVIKAHRAEEGSEGSILSKPMCDQFLSEQLNAWGLGPRLFIEDGKTIGFHHAGANEGYRCNSVAFLDGRGAVVMTNSDVGDALVSEIMSAAAEVYDWPAQKPKRVDWLPLADNEKTRWTGLYTFAQKGKIREVKVESNGGGLYITSSYFPKAAYYRTEHKGNAASFTGNPGFPAVFSQDEKGKPILTLLDTVFTQ